jgi:hypothetical protein
MIGAGSFEAVKLGARMTAQRKGRSALLRPLAAAFAGVLATIFLLQIVGLVHVADVRRDRQISRNPIRSSSGSLLWARPLGDEYWRGHPITRILLAPAPGSTGKPVLPPGLSRLPGPDEVALSPQLTHLLPHDRYLQARYGGLHILPIQRQGLLGPDELLAYVGVTASSLSGNSEMLKIAVTRTSSFGGSAEGPLDMPGKPGIMAFLVLAILVLLPFAVVCATLARMGAAAREKRLVALRILGIKPAHIRIVAATEAALATAVGGLLGMVAFEVLRTYTTPLAWNGVLPFRADLSVSVPGMVAVWLALSCVAALSGIASAGRVSPLSRTTRPVLTPRPTRRRNLLVLAAGATVVLAVWAWVTWSPARSHQGMLVEVMTLTVAAITTASGVAIALPVLLQMAASAAARSGLPPIRQMAARRLAADPGSLTRAAGVFSIAVFVVGLTTTLMAAFDPTDWINHDRQQINYHGRTTTVVRAPTPSMMADPAVAAATRGALVLPVVQLVAPGDTPPVAGLLADCAQLRTLSSNPQLPCPAGPTVLNTTGAPIEGMDPVRPGTPLTLTVPGHTTRLRWPTSRTTIDVPFETNLNGIMAITPASLGVHQPLTTSVAGLIINFPSSDDRLEYLRATIHRAGPLAVVIVPGESDLHGGASAYAGIAHTIQRLSIIGTLLLLLGLFATALDAVAVRARQQIPLQALGIPSKGLARVLALETLAPVLAGGFLGGTASWLVCHTFATYGRSPFPGTAFAELAVGVILAAAFITGAAWLNAHRNRELTALRTE